MNGGESSAFNLGTGHGHSVREVIEAVERVGGKPVPRVDSPRRAGDPPALVADARRAREVLGWTARFADLDMIIGHAWQWHTKGASARAL